MDKGWGRRMSRIWRLWTCCSNSRGKHNNAGIPLLLDPFWSDLWDLTSQEKLWRHKVSNMTCKPPPDPPDPPWHRRICCYIWNTPMPKSKTYKPCYVIVMPRSAWVIFSDQKRKPWKLIGYSQNGNSITNVDTNAGGLQRTEALVANNTSSIRC